MGTINTEGVASIAALRALIGVEVGAQLSVQDYNGDNKGGGEDFECVDTVVGSYVDDGGSIIIGDDNRVYKMKTPVILDVRSFGVNEIDADNGIRINNAITYAKITPSIKQIVCRGVIKIQTTIELDFELDTNPIVNYNVNNSCNVDLCWDTSSVLLYTGTNTSVRIGVTNQNEIKVKTRRNTAWWNDADLTSIGIHHNPINNPIASGDFWIEAQGFHKGYYGNPDNTGMVQNRFQLGSIFDNCWNFYISPINSGWWNSNTVWSGECKQRTSGVDYLGETPRGIWLTGSQNTNRFINVNLEGAHIIESIRIDSGDSNVFDGCRFEANPDNAVVFGSGATNNRLTNCNGNDGSIYDMPDALVDDQNSYGYNLVEGCGRRTARNNGESAAFYARRGTGLTSTPAFATEAYHHPGEKTFEMDNIGNTQWTAKNSSYNNAYPNLRYEPHLGTLKTGSGNSDPTTLFDLVTYGGRLMKNFRQDEGQFYETYQDIIIADPYLAGIISNINNGAYFIDGSAPVMSVTGFSGYDNGKIARFIVRQASGGNKITFVNSPTLITINNKDVTLKNGDIALFKNIGSEMHMMNLPKSLQIENEKDIYIESIVALKALIDKNIGDVVTTSSYYGDSKGGGNSYVKVTDTGQIDNGGTIIEANDGSIYEMVIDDNLTYLNASSFGIQKNQTSSSNSAKLNAMAVYINDDSYYTGININEPINVDSTIIFYKCKVNMRGGSINHDGASLTEDVCVFGDKIGKTQCGNLLENISARRTVLSAARTNGASIVIVNAVNSKIDIIEALGSIIGIELFASTAWAYNTINLLNIYNNKYGIKTTQYAGGYINENLFIGGRFNLQSNFETNYHANTIKLKLGQDINEDGGATNPLNNNVFIKPCLETTVDDHVIMELKNFYNNRFESIRNESSGSAPIINIGSSSTASSGNKFDFYGGDAMPIFNRFNALDTSEITVNGRSQKYHQLVKWNKDDAYWFKKYFSELGRCYIKSLNNGSLIGRTASSIQADAAGLGYLRESGLYVPPSNSLFGFWLKVDPGTSVIKMFVDCDDWRYGIKCFKNNVLIETITALSTSHGHTLLAGVGMVNGSDLLKPGVVSIYPNYSEVDSIFVGIYNSGTTQETVKNITVEASTNIYLLNEVVKHNKKITDIEIPVSGYHTIGDKYSLSTDRTIEYLCTLTGDFDDVGNEPTFITRYLTAKAIISNSPTLDNINGNIYNENNAVNIPSITCYNPIINGNCTFLMNTGTRGSFMTVSMSGGTSTHLPDDSVYADNTIYRYHIVSKDGVNCEYFISKLS